MIHGWSAFGGPTMVGKMLDWKEELGRWLKPFLDRLGHKARRQMCPLYVSGLIGPGDRKSIAPMAEQLALGEYDQLHHFIAAGVWDSAQVETELLVQADRLVGGSDAVLVIDDTAIPKKGTHSVGVAAQYASALGKTANCQTLVSLTLARGEVPVMLALRLFLPESWTSKRARLERAGVPTEYRTARTKPEMALAEIDRVIAAGVRFACVLADAGYGLSAPFRQGLTARKLAWAVGIPRHLKVYPADVQMIWPVAELLLSKLSETVVVHGNVPHDRPRSLVSHLIGNRASFLCTKAPMLRVPDKISRWHSQDLLGGPFASSPPDQCTIGRTHIGGRAGGCGRLPARPRSAHWVERAGVQTDCFCGSDGFRKM